MARVLVAVDGSDLDTHVLSVTHRLFGDEAEYLAINVADSQFDSTMAMPVPYGVVFPTYVGPMPNVEGSQVDHFARAEAVAKRATQDEGIPGATALADVGDPGDAIVEAARLHRVDVVVVGSRERGWFSRLVETSVSGEVISASAVPVLVVKVPHDEHAE